MILLGDNISMLKFFKKIILIIAFSVLSISAFSQLSPGDLAEQHSHLEGLTNCTECHSFGKKISNDKCLVCHTLIKERIDSNKGFHSSSDIKGKDCITCHSDHNGKKFKLIRFDENSFDHSKTGYKLEGAHAKKDCKDCHKGDFIKNKKIKKKKKTFLGLNTDCLACHADYHQKTLSSNCTDCHGIDSFKPTTKFNHDKSKFSLVGKHKDVDCIKCHKKINLNGKDFQMFSDIEFESCTSCHTDVHDDKFGQNCTKCHSEESFHIIKGMDNFDHNKTNFKLENKHKDVECKKCHKTKLTDHIRHLNCTDCHTDYHKKQFVKNGIAPDCSDCHTTKGFVGSSFTIEKHSQTEFPLVGAHLATPCFVCHKKESTWNFGNMGTQCTDCHDDIHKSFISEKYYPESDCKNCHNENTWLSINFDHSKTDYKLLGAHKKQTCKACHFRVDSNGEKTQKFANLSTNCTTCHLDKHYSQFEENGITDCKRCHDNNNWKAEKFNHDNTRFKLDGKHEKVACAECHKATTTGNNNYVVYKLNKLKCENCH